MINLLLSLAAALLTFCAFFFSGLAHALGSIFPAVVAGIVAYILLARRTVKQLEGLMAQVQKELAGRRIEKAIALLEASFPMARWQFLVASLLYAVYAWCEDKRGERKKAIEVLQRGAGQVKSDDRLKTLLTRLQNDKRLKLESFGEQWWQFWLETPPMMQGPGGAFGARQVKWGRR